MRIDDILDKLKDKYNLPKVELERIIDSQYKLCFESMEKRTTKTIKLAYLGKIKPSNFLIKYHEQLSKKS
jgi:hypothetical protein